MITFKNLTKQFHNQPALNNLSFSINSHELFVLVGPSGSGKTTLLKMINRLNVPTSGTVFIDDQNLADVSDVRKMRQTIGYVLQSGALFPNMTVTQNAAIQLAPLNWSPEKQAVRINNLLTMVGLDPATFAKRMPNELSGGEAQRVGIVRALAANPNIVLMDEPFSALDPLSRHQLQQLMLKLHQELTTTFVFVTHDMEEALLLADRLAVLHSGQLQQLGTPAEIITSPKTPFVADFFAGNRHQGQYLSHIVAAGYGHPRSGSTETQTLTGSDTIATWAKLLLNEPQKSILVANTVLTIHDLIAYLSTREGGIK